MVVEPPLTPVIIPVVLPTVAIAVLLLLHVPPFTVLLHVTLLPVHTLLAPLIVPALAALFTVIGKVVDANVHAVVTV